MFQSLKWVLPSAAVVALFVGFAVTSARAADAPAKKTITGTVTGTDDKPVEGATVNLVRPGARRGGGAGGAGGAGAALPGGGGGGGGRAATPPLATTTTAADGTFKLEYDPATVTAGDYNIRVMKTGGTTGTTGTLAIKVDDKGVATMADPKDATKQVPADKVTIKLAARAARGGAGGGGAGL